VAKPAVSGTLPSSTTRGVGQWRNQLASSSLKTMTSRCWLRTLPSALPRLMLPIHPALAHHPVLAARHLLAGQLVSELGCASGQMGALEAMWAPAYIAGQVTPTSFLPLASRPHHSLA
jgi:hypothetical protein